MKKVIIVIAVALISLASCEKKWSCTQTVTMSGAAIFGDSASVVSIATTYEFEGTRKEMKEFEATGNSEIYGPTSVMECK